MSESAISEPDEFGHRTVTTWRVVAAGKALTRPYYRREIAEIWLENLRQEQPDAKLHMGMTIVYAHDHDAAEVLAAARVGEQHDAEVLRRFRVPALRLVAAPGADA